MATQEEIDRYNAYKAHMEKTGEQPGPKAQEFMARVESEVAASAEQPARGNFLWQVGEIDTPGERLGADVGKALGSGVQQGVAGMVALPGAAANLAANLFGHDFAEEGDVSFLPGFQSSSEGMRAASQAIDPNAPTIGYEPETSLGGYVQTGGEFFGGAPMAGGATWGNLIRNVLAPAAGSEFIGQALEGDEMEGLGRLFGAVGGSLTASGLSKLASPTNVDDAAALVRLQQKGVKPSAGQLADDDTLRAVEQMSRGGKAAQQQGLETFTKATMKAAGFGDELPTPEVMDDLFTTLGGKMDDLAARSTPILDQQAFDDFAQLADDYGAALGPDKKSPLFDNLLEGIFEAYERGEGVTGFQDAQRQLNLLSKEPGITGETARQFKQAMMRWLERSEPGLADEWAAVNGLYRNALVIEDAIKGTTSSAKGSMVTPSKLSQSVRNIYGTRAYTTKRGAVDPLRELADDADSVLQGLGQSGTAPRAAAAGLPGMGAVGGFGALAAGANPGVALGVGAASHFLPQLRAAAVASQVGQRYLKNQILQHADMGDVLSIFQNPATYSPYNQ